MAETTLLIITLLIVVICLALLVIEFYSRVHSLAMVKQPVEVEAFDEAFLSEGVRNDR